MKKLASMPTAFWFDIFFQNLFKVMGFERINATLALLRLQSTSYNLYPSDFQARIVASREAAFPA
uniref:hypothetical protein n=1 Tax=Algoriphagus sp. TaxID=1872435 RepID=UPI004047B662